jgi:hypothetical protein
VVFIDHPSWRGTAVAGRQNRLTSVLAPVCGAVFRTLVGGAHPYRGRSQAAICTTRLCLAALTVCFWLMPGQTP